MKTSKKLWNNIWKKSFHQEPHENVIDCVTSLKDVEKILELGAGTGTDLIELSKKGYDVTYSDFSNVALNNFIKKNSKIKSILCDARNVPFRKNTFDLVYCLGLLEHFSCKDRQKIISELFRVSRKFVLIDVPQAYTLTFLIKRLLMAIGKWQYGDEIEFSYKKLNNEVSDSVKENTHSYLIYGRELIPLPRALKNKLFMNLPRKVRKTYIASVNKFYFLCGCLGIIYKKI